jgi:hypothetical chaperone protein
MQRLIGVDFGTTNSVVSLLAADGSVQSTRIAIGAEMLDVVRSVLCLWEEPQPGRRVLRHEVGPAAIDAYLDQPHDSRLIMSMKSYLAQRSFTETRLFNRPFKLEALIAIFLRALLAGNDPATHIVAGRPVRFAGEFADDAFGETRLRGAYAEAGFADVDIALEPEAAGYRFARGLNHAATVLIGDFGGGTSDFSLLRFEPGAARRVVPLAHSGIGIAGDVFDYRIIDRVISPLLGKGDTYRVMTTDLPVPPDYYSSFARWHLLSLMNTPRTLADIADTARKAAHPERLRNLITLIEDELGYRLYRTVSSVKAALSKDDSATLRFEHKDFRVDREIRRAEFEEWIAPDVAKLAATVDTAMQDAACSETDIDHVFLTGGTSFVPAVRALFTERFGEEKVSAGGEFVSVSEGLALIGRDRMAAAQR